MSDEVRPTPRATPRVLPRAALDCAVTLTVAGQSKLTCRSVDLSPGGISLLTPTQLRLAQYCALSFELDSPDGPCLVEAMGQVIYCERAPERGFRSGVQFLHLEPSSMAAITGLLSRAG
ncbi:MAG: PilZ domain-containing protein [Pseudomonadota bacterium]